FHGGVGALFGVLASRPFWNSGMFPIIFLVSALASGGALLVVASAIFQQGWKAHRAMILDLGKIVLGLLLLDILFQISEALIGLYGSDPGFVASFELVVAGPYWYVFWFLQIGVGFVVPVILLATPFRRDPRAVILACGAVVIGFVGVRLNIVIPGLSPEEIRGITQSVTDPRMASSYFPSAWEWILSFGIGAVGLVLFALGDYFLPMTRHLPPTATQD
ncbi:MAG: polysulfide reductase NrfD, partial [Acidimicrobiia bacterium]|nr:polysulfide reductase NrfD [Acidimicrobiia bacterium]